VLALNLGVLVVVQAAAWGLQEQWLSEQSRTYQDFLGRLVRDAYGASPHGSTETLRALLGRVRLREVLSDILVTNGRSPEAPGFVDINPFGAAHRRHEAFPVQAVRGGIQQAMETGALVRVADGYCVPITAGGEIVAGAWYVPILAPPPTLPLAVLAATLLAGTLLLGGLAYYLLDRSLVRPLRALGEAAARVGAGEYGVRVPRVRGAAELNPLVDSFNAMAARVAGHTDELAREVRRATEEAQRRERALVVSGRLAAMGTLAAGIAHEINNPIGGMLNAVNRLAAAPQVTEQQRRYLELIRDGLQRVGDIARKVLDFSPRRLQPMAFRLERAVEGARALVEHRLRRHGIELEVDVAPDVGELMGEPHEIQQVFLNLFLNSVDALEAREPPRRIKVTARRAGAQAEVEVEDNGPGMPREQLERVFDPFFSTKGKPDATGLGMFISFQIVANHGGQMEVASDVGGGFTTRIRLPLRETS
jgi:signal transduction histidine kinase